MLIEEAINVWLRIINNNNKTIVKSESYRSGYSALVILLGALKLSTLFFKCNGQTLRITKQKHWLVLV